MPVTKILYSKSTVETGTGYISNKEKTTVKAETVPEGEQVDVALTVKVPFSQKDYDRMNFSDERSEDVASVKVDLTDDEVHPYNLDQIIAYANDALKTKTGEGERRLVCGINCGALSAAEDMRATKARWGKYGGRTYYHLMQSVKPGEGTPDTVHRLGVETAQRLFGERFEVLVCTHLNEPHLHNHFIVNSVSFVDGHKLHVDKKFYYEQIRGISDELSRKYGFSIIDEPRNNPSPYLPEGAHTWREAIRRDVDAALHGAKSWDDFAITLIEMGYRIKYGERISVQPPERTDSKYFRLDRLTKDGAYSEANILKAISQGTAIGETVLDGLPVRRYHKPIRKSYTVRKPAHKIRGWRAQYLRYCYMIGAIKPRSYDYARYRRAGVVALGKIQRHILFLSEHRIDTQSQLDEYTDALKGKRKALSNERLRLVRMLKKSPSEEVMLEIQSRMEEIDSEKAEIAKEMKICKEITERSSENEEHPSEKTNSKKKER